MFRSTSPLPMDAPARASSTPARRPAKRRSLPPVGAQATRQDVDAGTPEGNRRFAGSLQHLSPVPALRALMTLVRSEMAQAARKFMQWPNPMLTTNSGGFQVFLALEYAQGGRRRRDLQELHDGRVRPHRFTPGRSSQIPNNLRGRHHHFWPSMECADPNEPRLPSKRRWSARTAGPRAFVESARPPRRQALFGIVQGARGLETARAIGGVHLVPAVSGHCHWRAFGGRDQRRNAPHAGCGHAAAASEQTALPDGGWHARRPDTRRPARGGYFRLRPAHPPGASPCGVFARRPPEPDEERRRLPAINAR